MIGKQILNYQITELIDSGGMGTVYKAIHKQFDRIVAIKILHQQLAQNPDVRQRFKNEATTLGRLQHPNIVTLYDYIEQDTTCALIMEYVKGKPLDKYINTISGPVPEEKAIKLFEQILQGVQYAHRLNIIHRDIKPSNFMITNDGNIKILDFGIAKILGNENFNLTSEGQQVGTKFYMSPEQVKGQALDRRTDIYSLGVTLFEVLTGQCPYKDITSEFELYNQIVEQPLPHAKSIYPQVSNKMQLLISKATEKKPDNRFSDCEAFQKALHTAPVTNEITPPPTRSMKKPNKNLKTIVGVLIVAAILIIAMLIINHFSKKSEDITADNIQDTIETVKTEPLTNEKTTEKDTTKEKSTEEINETADKTTEKTNGKEQPHEHKQQITNSGTPHINSFDDYFVHIANKNYTYKTRQKLIKNCLKECSNPNIPVQIYIGDVNTQEFTMKNYLNRLLIQNKKVTIRNKQRNHKNKIIKISVTE